MPVISLEDAAKEFEAALGEIRSNFEFVRTAEELRPRLEAMLNRQGMDTEAQKLAAAFLRQRTSEKAVLYRGLIIASAGAFEQFVRKILRDSIHLVNKSELPYDGLDQVLRKHNICRTGEALQTIFEPIEYLELDYDLLSKNVGTCFTGSKQPILNADVFAIFISVIAPEKLGKALERIGARVEWDFFGRSPALQKVFGTRGARETTKELQQFLKRFEQKRNKIAHTGTSGLLITEADLEQHLSVLGIFAPLLTSFVEARLKKTLGS